MNRKNVIRTLTAIAATRPESLDSLARIRGVGPAFIERHGADILALLATSAGGDGEMVSAVGDLGS